MQGKNKIRQNLGWLVIGFPLLLSVVYLFALSQDRYASDAVIVVKRTNDVESGGSSLGSLLGSASPVAREDAMYLQEYIISADMLNRLDKELQLRNEFHSAGWDFLHRLPADASREEFLDYYRSRLEINYDEKSALLSIRAIGFSPKFALDFNKAILTESDKFINEISHGVAREQMQYAQSELEKSYQKLSAAKDKMLSYQNANGILDPQTKAEAASKLIADLEARLAQLEAEQRNLLSYLNSDAPQIKSSTGVIQALKSQIESEKAKLTSAKDNKLNKMAVQFQELKANIDFQADLYRLSLSAVEKIRIESARKLKTLVVISAPQLPEDPVYPRKFYLIGTVLLCSVLVFGICRLVISVIEDHKE